MEGLTHHEKENRPWGDFERFTLNEKTTVKIITVHRGESLSLQTHEHREEFWRVVSGNGIFHVGEENHQVKTGDTVFIPCHCKHRATGGTDDLVFLEIAFGDFDENDITRLEDSYGRT
ncbi:MAG: phosphomannose isomerase type II C-terminal cupin domain [Candidatus Kaiserbacteria bacterium]|nr:phosphomannose isomerase type II C-terminal cupin domain [Candidatus Kaiserbacteria bacterium]